MKLLVSDVLPDVTALMQLPEVCERPLLHLNVIRIANHGLHAISTQKGPTTFMTTSLAEHTASMPSQRHRSGHRVVAWQQGRLGQHF